MDLGTAQIRLACVFGNLGNEALIVTRDGEVLALGSNGVGCLGLRGVTIRIIISPTKYKKA